MGGSTDCKFAVFDHVGSNPTSPKGDYYEIQYKKK